MKLQYSFWESLDKDSCPIDGIVLFSLNSHLSKRAGVNIRNKSRMDVLFPQIFGAADSNKGPDKIKRKSKKVLVSTLPHIMIVHAGGWS